MLGIVISYSQQTVVDIIVNSPDHNTLEAAVIAVELADDPSGAIPFTVFALRMLHLLPCPLARLKLCCKTPLANWRKSCCTML
ncbi:MAG: hypothetical protein R2795_24365 [Saprospiraceae bacterium]